MSEKKIQGDFALKKDYKEPELEILNFDSEVCLSTSGDEIYHEFGNEWLD